MPATASRIVALDALRGAGILGILAVHIQLFAMPVATRFDPTVFGSLRGVDGVVWLLTYVLADGKFLAMFAMLFGAGIAIQVAGYEAAGESAVAPHYRRMAALLVLGVGHAYLLWYGDMLVTFALCGALAFLQREQPPKGLVVLGLVMLAIAPLLNSALAWMAADVAQSEALSGARDAVAREIAAYRGGWALQQTHRVPTAWEFQTSHLALRGAWQTTGLMLLGMGLFRMRVLALPTRAYVAVAAVGFAVGVPMMLLAARRAIAHGWDFRDHMLVRIHLVYWADVLLGFAWIALILALHRRGLVPGAIAAVGRMALSNYLLATLVCTTVFYGHGLGLFGSVSRAGQLAIVAGVWTIQLVVSRWWLSRFSMGPVEWALRSAAHLRVQSIRLTTAEPRRTVDPRHANG